MKKDLYKHSFLNYYLCAYFLTYTIISKKLLCCKSFFKFCGLNFILFAVVFTFDFTHLSLYSLSYFIIKVGREPFGAAVAAVRTAAAAVRSWIVRATDDVIATHASSTAGVVRLLSPLPYISS